MKIMCNDKIAIELNDDHMKILAHDLPSSTLDVDIQRRVNWILSHKLEQCMKRIREEWLPKLKNNGVKSVPVDDIEFARLVFSQPNYKDRSTRDREASLK